MTGESLLRLYVYGLALAFLTWMLLMGWLVTRSARRYLRRDRSLATAQSDVGQVAQVGERHHLPI
jgi:threonine/homoserine/homoserine lactone efflux protein